MSARWTAAVLVLFLWTTGCTSNDQAANRSGTLPQAIGSPASSAPSVSATPAPSSTSPVPLPAACRGARLTLLESAGAGAGAGGATLHTLVLDSTGGCRLRDHISYVVTGPGPVRGSYAASGGGAFDLPANNEVTSVAPGRPVVLTLSSSSGSDGGACNRYALSVAPFAASSERVGAISVPLCSRPVTSAARAAVTLSATSVVGVRLGTAASEAERRLRAALGTPRSNQLPGCNGERGHTLRWDRLTAVFAEESGGVVLQGWRADAGAGTRVILPYNTSLGMPVSLVKDRVPGGRWTVAAEGELAGSYVLSTPRMPGLLWVADADRGSVGSALFNSPGCD